MVSGLILVQNFEECGVSLDGVKYASLFGTELLQVKEEGVSIDSLVLLKGPVVYMIFFPDFLVFLEEKDE